MKRISLFIIPLVLLLALAPPPSAANEGGGGDGGGDRDRDEAVKDFRGFRAAANFFATFLVSKGNLFIAAVEASDIVHFGYGVTRETWAEESQRLFVERVVAERARRNAERQAQEAENSKRAENISDDDLPGLDPD